MFKQRKGERVGAGIKTNDTKQESWEYKWAKEMNYCHLLVACYIITICFWKIHDAVKKKRTSIKSDSSGTKILVIHLHSSEGVNHPVTPD